MAAGSFIAFEGVDGSGKTTQIRRLAQRLEAAGRQVLVVREPGGTAVGEEVRKILLHRQEIPLHVDTETLLFLSSRVQLYEEVISAALARGDVVLSDRFHLSTLVYQGWARERDLAGLRALLECVLEGRRPQLHVVIDVPLEVSLSRMGDEPDRFEGDPEFLRRVVDGFRRGEGLPGDKIVRVDGSGPPDVVASRVYEEVKHAL